MAKKEKAPMSPIDCIGQAVAALRRLGFRSNEISRSRKSPSRYVTWPGSGMQIRVSNFRWPPKSKLRRQFPNVLTTILFDRPMTQDEVEHRVQMAVQAFHDVWRQRRVEATSTNPEDMPWRFSENNSSAVVESTTSCSVSDAVAVTYPDPSA